MLNVTMWLSLGALVYQFCSSISTLLCLIIAMAIKKIGEAVQKLAHKFDGYYAVSEFISSLV